MTKSEYKETLEKQLQLLSERSEISDTDDLPRLTDAMLEVCKMLTSDDFPSEITAAEFGGRGERFAYLERCLHDKNIGLTQKEIMEYNRLLAEICEDTENSGDNSTDSGNDSKK